MRIELCDICKNELDEVYSLRMYKGIISDDFFITKHICFDCYSKIKKYIKSICK